MQKVDLKKNTIIKDWFSTVESKNTKSSYLQGMFFYTELIQKTPDELIDEATNEQVSGKLMLQRNILKYFDRFLYFLKNRKLAPKTIKSYMSAIRSFYNFKYIEVPNIKLPKGKTLTKNKDVPTKAEIQETLEHCNKLEKAIILTGVSSGLSDVDIVNLKISDFKKGYDPDNKIVILNLARHKLGDTADKFTTFLSPEAIKAINDYLDFRNRDCKVNFKRENDRIDKQRVVSDDGYLFIKKHVPASYLETGNEEERKITDTNLIQIYRGVSEKARKNTPFGNWNLIRSHNMRKYFYNVLTNNKCSYLHAEHMMGHVLDGVRGGYFVPTVEELKKSYLECLPFLIIQKQLDVSESPEFIKMKTDNEVLIREIASKTVERDEIVRLSADIENYKNEMELKSEIERNKHSIQILKLQKKIHPEKAGEINKMIEGLKNASNHMHNKLYKEYEKYREDVEEPELLNES